MAVDTAGDVYVTDAGRTGGIEFAAGSNAPTVLPFTGLDCPAVWRWTPRATSSSPTHPITGVQVGARVERSTALRFAGLDYPLYRGPRRRRVYVTTLLTVGWWSWRQGQWSNRAAVTGLDDAEDVAVDAAGDVYVADYQNSRVLKLPAQ